MEVLADREGSTSDGALDCRAEDAMQSVNLATGVTTGVKTWGQRWVPRRGPGPWLSPHQDVAQVGGAPKCKQRSRGKEGRQFRGPIKEVFMRVMGLTDVVHAGMIGGHEGDPGLVGMRGSRGSQKGGSILGGHLLEDIGDEVGLVAAPAEVGEEFR